MEKIVKPSLFHDRKVEQKPKSTFKRQNGLLVGLSIVLLLYAVFCVPIKLRESPAYHLKKISELVAQRYFLKGSTYTGYTIYPLYDEQDKPTYVLVELEPHGYTYLKPVNNIPLISRLFTSSIYMCSSRDLKAPQTTWQRYTIEEGLETVIKDKYGWDVLYKHRRWETDENGNYIEYLDSHFKVAGIQDEKRYWLYLQHTKNLGGQSGYVPAVKRNGKYINLISMEEMDYTPGVPAAYPIADDRFYELHYSL